MSIIQLREERTTVAMFMSVFGNNDAKMLFLCVLLISARIYVCVRHGSGEREWVFVIASVECKTTTEMRRRYWKGERKRENKTTQFMCGLSRKGSHSDNHGTSLLVGGH